MFISISFIFDFYTQNEGIKMTKIETTKIQNELGIEIN